MGGKGSKGGSGGGKGSTTTGGSGGKGAQNRPVENVDINDMPSSNPDYPPPYVPETYKDELFTESIVKDIQTKLTNLPKNADGSYTSLLKTLSTLADTEVQFVIAVYLWMKSQDYNSSTLDLVKAGDTPKGYMKMIKEGTGDHTSFFTIMCRRSGIPCILMDGIGKGKDYAVGDSEKQLATRWTIVYADTEWHMAHIDWCMKDKQDDKMSSEFFFLTDPDDFAKYCFPDNYQWQLLDRPISKKEFLTQPHCRPKFYELDGSVVSPKTAVFKAQNGKANVEISFPKSQMQRVNLSHLLTYIDTPSEEHDDTTNMLNNLEKFVFLNRKPGMFVFEIILPVPGRYVFDVFGEIEQKPKEDGDTEEENAAEIEKFCQFRLSSNKTFEAEDLELLPETPVNGWGPGPKCKTLGLVPKSHTEGVIYMKPGEARTVVFKMKKDLEVTCQLTHNFIPVYVLVEQVECTTSDHEASIKVRIPEDGQYALKVYCRDTGSKGYNEACTYLIRQRTKTRLPEKYRDKMIRSRLEYHIDNHTSEKALEDAIEVFMCYNVPDNGELKRADQKLKQYWQTKRELRGAVIGRNVKVSHKWLDKANHSKYKTDLQEEIKQAERMEKNMGRLKGNSHPIGKMDPHSVIEIRNYNRPSPIVRDVMKSTYLLLGEKPDDIEDWEQIQYLLGKTGNNQIQKRVVSRRAEAIPVETAIQAERVIEPYNLQKCRAVSNGICAYYNWDKQMIKDVKQLEEERKRNERERDSYMTDFHDNESERGERGDKSRTQSRSESRHSGTDSKPETFRSDSRKMEDGKPNDTYHPFAVNDESGPPPPRFSSRPSEKQEDKPVEYAGWKPQNL